MNIPTICITHDDHIASAPITSKTQERGPHGNYSCAFDDNVGLYCVHWKEISVVAMPSNCIGSYPLQTVDRYSRKDHRKVQVNRSKLIKTYSNTMGGENLADAGVGEYKSQIKRRKWWWPHFTNTPGVLLRAAWKIYWLTNPDEVQLLLFVV